MSKMPRTRSRPRRDSGGQPAAFRTAVKSTLRNPGRATWATWARSGNDATVLAVVFLRFFLFTVVIGSVWEDNDDDVSRLKCAGRQHFRQHVSEAYLPLPYSTLEDFQCCFIVISVITCQIHMPGPDDGSDSVIVDAPPSFLPVLEPVLVIAKTFSSPVFLPQARSG